MKRLSIIIRLSILLLLSLMIIGCSKKEEIIEDYYIIDYLVLVNKLNALPSDWEKDLKTEHFTNTIGDDVEVEIKAYEAYLKLKEELETEGVFVDLDSARRSIEAQKKILNDFTEKYGADYALKIVAKPGYSEHHTGLALDLYLIVDGKDIIENEDLVQYPEIWEIIHNKLAKYGFVLRYLPDKEHITGYAYEPWHIRYINNADLAKQISDKNITLEGHLGVVDEVEPIIDLGKSELYSPEELNEMAILIKCQFAALKDCELHQLRYAGDEIVNEDNLSWINSMDNNPQYKKVAAFYMDFHTPKESELAFEKDHEYTDYQWWLGQNEDDSWEVASYGNKGE